MRLRTSKFGSETTISDFEESSSPPGKSTDSWAKAYAAIRSQNGRIFKKRIRDLEIEQYRICKEINPQMIDSTVELR
jgi:hypothetical protein